MFELNLTPEFLSYLLAAVLAAVFDWFPAVRAWFDLFPEQQKKLFMAIVLGFIVGIIYALGCTGYLANMTCDSLTLQRLLTMYFIAIGINQGVHKLTKRNSAEDLVSV